MVNLRGGSQNSDLPQQGVRKIKYHTTGVIAKFFFFLGGGGEFSRFLIPPPAVVNDVSHSFFFNVFGYILARNGPISIP